MPLKRHNQDSSPRTTPFEDDSYPARIVQVIDIGKQPQIDFTTQEEKEPKYEVMVTFEFPTVRNEQDKPCWLSKRFSFPQAYPDKPGINAKSNLYKFLNVVVPNDLARSKMYPDYFFINDSAWENLLNKPVFVEVVVNSKGYANVKSIRSLPSIVGQVAQLETAPMLFDTVEGTVEEWNGLFAFVQRLILNNLDDEVRACAEALAKEAYNSETEGDEPEEEDYKV